MHYILSSFILGGFEALEVQQKEEKKQIGTLLWKSAITFISAFYLFKSVSYKPHNLPQQAVIYLFPRKTVICVCI